MFTPAISIILQRYLHYQSHQPSQFSGYIQQPQNNYKKRKGPEDPNIGPSAQVLTMSNAMYSS